MKKTLLFLFLMIILSLNTWSQVVTTASGVTVCTGTATVDIPVKVSSFTAVGSISLRFTYVNSEITSPSVVYKDAGLDAWGTFIANTSTAGVIVISAYDPDVVVPITGLTLSDNTILFTLRFTIATISTPAVLAFSENAQGTWCEYGGIGPNYTPFTDTPTATYYINGSVAVVADPVAPALTKSPPDASVCAGQTLTVTATAGSGGTGTITEEYRYSTNNGTSWSSWSVSLPSFAAVTGTDKVQSRRTATGTGCDESAYIEVSWTVNDGPVAPGLTKNPTDATVCSGQSLTVTTSAGSGGTGTIADEYSYSTNNGSSWSSWSTSAPSFAAVTGTDLIRSRRTASGSGCSESAYNSVSWTVVADPVAPGITKSPADASVCAGDILTVTTTAGSGGTGTIADEYRYSTNNGSSWSSWSATVPSFASVAGTNKIQSRRTATGTGCDESAYNEVSWTVNAKQKISGTINYYHSSGNILLTGADITVKLYKTSDASHSTLIATDVTDNSGYFEFSSICPDCIYDMVATSAHSTSGAINTTDAAQANYWGPNPYAIEKVRFHAGDVSGPDLFVGGIDAGRIQQNFVNGLALDGDPWTFWKTNALILHNPLLAEPEYTEYYPTVSLAVGSDATANLYGLVTGDFNRSFNPDVTKSASATLDLAYSGNIMIGKNQEFDLPVKITDGAKVGAVSLILEIPADLVEVNDVIMNGTGGQLDWSVKGNELRISWMSAVPMDLTAMSELLRLKLKTNGDFIEGKSIRIKLAGDPLNELADANYDVISHALLQIDAVDGSALGIGDNSSKRLAMTCYPNPFKNTTTITFSVPFAGMATLEVSNLLGTRMAVLLSENKVSGTYKIEFNADDLPEGIYSASLRLKSTDNEIFQTIKMVINR
jgi:hypothetical protein